MNNQAGSPKAAGTGREGPQFWLWERSFELAVSIFKIADRIPADLGLSLPGQMRLTALAVPSYLSCTKSKGSEREFVRGLSHAIGALAELETQLALSCELGYASETEERRLQTGIRELKRASARLLRRLRGLLSGNRLQAISEEIAALVSEENEGSPGGGV